MNELRWWRARGAGLGWRDWLLLGEAFCCLCVAKGLLAVVPVKWLLGKADGGPTDRDGGAMQGGRGSAGRVRWAVESVARRSPVRFVCFPQCLAAEWMLRRRGVGSVLHYGIRRDDSAGGRLLAHTWLESGGEMLIGEGEGFSVLGEFGR